MKPSMRHIALCSATFAGIIMLSGCGKHDEATDTAPPAASTAPAPSAAPATPLPAPAPSSTAAMPAPSGSAAMPPAAARTSASLNPASLKVTSVRLGNKVTGDGDVREQRTTFAPNDPTIYASVITEGETRGATLSAAWSYLEGKAQPITQTDQQFAATGEAVTTFQVRNPNPWPAGKYQVVISLNGQPVSTQPFEVSKS